MPRQTDAARLHLNFGSLLDNDFHLVDSECWRDTDTALASSHMYRYIHILDIRHSVTFLRSTCESAWSRLSLNLHPTGDDHGTISMCVCVGVAVWQKRQQKLYIYT